MCNCNRIYITSLTTTSTGVVLIPSRQIQQINLTNTGKYELIIACGLKATNSLPIFIQTSAGNIPLLDKFAPRKGLNIDSRKLDQNEMNTIKKIMYEKEMVMQSNGVYDYFIYYEKKK